MKTRNKFQILLVSTLFVLAQHVCAKDEQTLHGPRHGQANAHMNTMDFERLVARFEAPDRGSVAKTGGGQGLRFLASGHAVLAVIVDDQFVHESNPQVVEDKSYYLQFQANKKFKRSDTIVSSLLCLGRHGKGKRLRPRYDCLGRLHFEPTYQDRSARRAGQRPFDDERDFLKASGLYMRYTS